VFAATEVPPTCIVLAPNHTGQGAAAALMDEGSWEIPTGEVPVDTSMSRDLLKACDELEPDILAHQFEHSLEVQLPFLLARQPELHIVPITVSHISFETCEKIGKAIAKTIKESGKDVLIVASSDMNHYESQDITKKKDNLAIDRVLAMDPKGLLTTCAQHGITMCGVVPTAIMLIASKELGATTATLVSHTTSGDTSGDYQAVVGYAGIIVR
jgi:AmmeMemoRadiSam system protein B